MEAETIPREGYVSITISQDVYDAIKKKMEAENKKAGYKKFRSVSHYVEQKIMESKKGKSENE